jgi:hypothetical protein
MAITKVTSGGISDIAAAVEGASDSNKFTDADHTKLNAIEASATADQTKSDIEGLGIDVPAANLTGTIADARFPATLPTASAANLTAIPAANITGTLPAISGANLTGIVSIPVGTEVLWATATAPTGWLEENGAAISRTTYADLYAVIGTTYGVGDGSSTFNLPDARGEFIRGWAHGSANDADRASRTSRGDGTTGDNVGTKQGHGTADHKHETGPSTYGSGSGSVNYIARLVWAAGVAGYGGGDMRTTPTSDTRPRNVNRMILIKY